MNLLLGCSLTTQPLLGQTGLKLSNSSESISKVMSAI